MSIYLINKLKQRDESRVKARLKRGLRIKKDSKNTKLIKFI